jgi:hypothetical protein
MEVSTNQTSSGFRQVIITKEELIRWNIRPPPLPPLRLIVSFKDQMITEEAKKWVRTFLQQNNIEMRFTHSLSTGFHVLELLGPDSAMQPIFDKLLKESPIEVEGYYAAFSDIQNNTCIDNPVGLNRAPEAVDMTEWEPQPTQD